jgi:hypothetical protein
MLPERLASVAGGRSPLLVAGAHRAGPGATTGWQNWCVPRSNARVYPPGDHGDVEVLVDGQWQEGELLFWTLSADGVRWAKVRHRAGPKLSTRLGRFPENQIRRSRGRAG